MRYLNDLFALLFVVIGVAILLVEVFWLPALLFYIVWKLT